MLGVVSDWGISMVLSEFSEPVLTRPEAVIISSGVSVLPESIGDSSALAPVSVDMGDISPEIVSSGMILLQVLSKLPDSENTILDQF